MNYTKLIDHTLLSPVTRENEIRKLCDEALKYGFASVCNNPVWVKLSSNLLQGTVVNVCIPVEDY
jgi:deoxyribose-phosphate aldolase